MSEEHLVRRGKELVYCNNTPNSSDKTSVYWVTGDKEEKTVPKEGWLKPNQLFRNSVKINSS